MHPLRAYRERERLTQLELAEKLGVVRTTVARWEVGMMEIGPKMLPRITKLTGIEGRRLRPDLAEALDA